ncbi:hypothetical protein PCANC_06545 [Puccinia coronata f. sp. avenae]|nr:hypothetical protein PCANC_06066 [Puccinia coronata f. sp. avenae]PLW46965.1 hypothetical protein PCANC_06545 [Puccinia coronata f. sp. avenae]
MKSLQCPNSNEFELSCLMIDSQSWPKNDIECGQTVHLNALQTIASAITRETNPAESKTAAPPPGLRPACNGKPIYQITHGNIVTYYTLDVSCKCQKDAEPNCSGATTQSAAACNFATIGYCGISVNNNPVCSA